MNLTPDQFLDIIPTIIPDIEDDEPFAVELIGPCGVGKSDLVRQTVRRIAMLRSEDWGMSTANFGLYSVPDMQGYLVPKHHPDGRTTSVFTEPAFFMCDDGRHNSEVQRWALFADEIGQAEAAEKKAFATMQLEMRAGVHKFPRSSVLFSAMNRTSDRSGVTKDYDFRINRRAEFHIVPDVTSWVTWATKNDVHPFGIVFAKNHPEIVFAGSHPKEQGPWCTPRSLVAAVKDLTRYARASNPDQRFPDLPSGNEAFAIASARLGAAATQQLMADLTLMRDAPTFEEIVVSPKTVRVPDAPDAQMMITYKLAHMCTTESVGAVLTYMERLPGDFCTTFITAIVQKRGTLVTHPAVMRWITKNQNLVNLMARR